MRAVTGARAAQSLLFERHAARVLGMLTRMLNSRADAEDAAQDAFQEAFTTLPRLQEPAAFASWLNRIAVSHAHRRFRRRKLLSFVGIGETLDATFDVLADPRETSESRAELGLLQKSLDRLPTLERSAWLLRFVEGHELTEVAEALGCSLATAKRKLSAAQTRLSSFTGLLERES